MKERWEERRISTPERIFEKIKTEMPQPVGIVLFGADCEFKSRVIDRILVGFRGELAWDFYSKITISRTKEIFSTACDFLVVLNSNESANPSMRRQCVSELEDCGAKSTVGIYVKARRAFIRPLTFDAEKEKYNDQLTAIEWSDPAADGLDYFVVSEKEKEG